MMPAFTVFLVEVDWADADDIVGIAKSIYCAEMRQLPRLVLLGLSTLSGCTAASEDDVVLTLYSKESEAALATCVSQNWFSAFPRFFPSEGAGKRKVFRTYNGIAVSIVSDDQERIIDVRSPKVLSHNMSDYLRRCSEGSFYRLR